MAEADTVEHSPGPVPVEGSLPPSIARYESSIDPSVDATIDPATMMPNNTFKGDFKLPPKVRTKSKTEKQWHRQLDAAGYGSGSPRGWPVHQQWHQHGAAPDSPTTVLRNFAASESSSASDGHSAPSPMHAGPMQPYAAQPYPYVLFPLAPYPDPGSPHAAPSPLMGSPVGTPTAMMFPQTPFAQHSPYPAFGGPPSSYPHEPMSPMSPTGSMSLGYFHPMFNNFATFMPSTLSNTSSHGPSRLSGTGDRRQSETAALLKEIARLSANGTASEGRTERDASGVSRQSSSIPGPAVQYDAPMRRPRRLSSLMAPMQLPPLQSSNSFSAEAAAAAAAAAAAFNMQPQQQYGQQAQQQYSQQPQYPLHSSGGSWNWASLLPGPIPVMQQMPPMASMQMMPMPGGPVPYGHGLPGVSSPVMPPPNMLHPVGFNLDAFGSPGNPGYGANNNSYFSPTELAQLQALTSAGMMNDAAVQNATQTLLSRAQAAAAAAAVPPQNRTYKPRRTGPDAKVGTDGQPRLNARQRRTLRRAKERALKGLMEAGQNLLAKANAVGKDDEVDLSDSEGEDEMTPAASSSTSPNVTISGEAPASAAATPSQENRTQTPDVKTPVSAEKQAGADLFQGGMDIGDLITRLSAKKEEGVVDEKLIRDLQIIQNLIGALKAPVPAPQQHPGSGRRNYHPHNPRGGNQYGPRGNEGYQLTNRKPISQQLVH